MKTVIFGNSGSGKTWLATKLAARTATPVVHLDALFWQPGGFDRKRKPTEIASLIASARSKPCWVVEGVFGELAATFLVHADLLIWLDLDWSVCEARLRARGSESKTHLARVQSEAGLAKLIDWASTYRTREDTRSFSGHLLLFNTFDGTKVCLIRESDVTCLLGNLEGNGYLTLRGPLPRAGAD